MEYISMEMIKQTPELNQSIPENFNFSPETFLAHHYQQYGFPVPSCAQNTILSPLHSSSCSLSEAADSIMVDENVFHKRNAMEQSTSSFQNQNISPAVSTSGFGGDTSNRKQNRNRGRRNEKNLEKSDEVVHVRAKRGQATDSHSIAERVRREKINEKMKCLQEIVPGCQKTKGMAIMLDEIINYVHSLQNQVEFLSMELAVASSSYDMKAQGRSTHVTQGMEKWVRGIYGEHNSLHSTWQL